MPRPRDRTRSVKRRRLSTPGGRSVTHYTTGKNKSARCSVCKRLLSGVPRSRLAKSSKLSKTAKRPERAHGGQICPSCLRDLIKKSVRGIG